jgi:hypothetical protein
MNAKTKEAIQRHGLSLLAAFPNATERDPVALCKKLRRIENSLTRPLTDYCNGDFDAGEDGEKLDAITDKALAKVRVILGMTPKSDSFADAYGLFINRDPRGYALKLDDEWTRVYNRTADIRIHSDWGGYGILAPDLTENN